MSKKKKSQTAKKVVKILKKPAAKKEVVQIPAITVPDIIEPAPNKKIIPPPRPIEEKKIMKEPAASNAPIIDRELMDDKNKVEALLFASGKYIDDNTISELCSIDKRRLKKILEELRKDYESRNNALTIFNEGNSWKINVREKYLSIVRKIVADTELPKSVMETLAVIAWKSPIYQSEVVRIRGNKCYDHIDILEESGFVVKEKKGRSYILKTTDKFFTYFEIDEGNIKGLFDTVKVPEIKEEQKTLDAELNPDLIKENVTDKVAAIDVKKWTETEEEKEGHKQFLSQIDNKLKEAQEKNRLLEADIPRPAIPQDITSSEIEQRTDVQNILSTDQQSPSSDENATPVQPDTTPRPKSLTKKQLEKKFKEELMKVREKMEKK